ncbi:uncharacterized protein BJX67DRAFT_112077 [Aspergillus lucknowensis]|uniref:Uncharacterized protein n=1 Tax=Aspergillus lucknowensis TaxID=176173 RepID=A0ABR4LRA4_9EURO
MKFTGILASLAIASSASAAALPKLNVVKIQSTVAHLDTVLDNIEATVPKGSSSDLSGLTSELGGIHSTLNGLVGSLVGTVESNGLVQGVLDVAGGLVTSVVGVLGSTDHVADFGVLSNTLISRIQSGEVDPAALEQLLTVIGGANGLSALNSVLSQQ